MRISKGFSAVVAVGLLCVLTSVAQAGVMTTEYASGASADGNMFDVSVSAGDDLTITGFDLNVGAQDFQQSGAGLAFSGLVYMKSGSYHGSEAVSGDWVLMSSFAGITNGKDNATHVNTADFVLTAGLDYALFIVLDSNLAANAMRYSNATFGEVVSNVDLALTMGAGKVALTGPYDAFGGATHEEEGEDRSRMWNGSIYYYRGDQPVPEPSVLIVLAVGLMGVGGLGRRRSKI